MSNARTLMAFCLAILVSEDGATREPPPAGHVIPGGQEGFFKDALSTVPGHEEWVVGSIRVDFNRVEVSLRSDRGTDVVVALVHPSVAADPLARSARFALVRIADRPPPPPEVIAAIAERLRSKETRFEWRFVEPRPPDATGRPEGSAPGSDPAGGTARTFSLPLDGNPSGRVAFPLPEPVAVSLQQAVEARNRGDPAPLTRIAHRLAKEGTKSPEMLRAAAFAFRLSGDVTRARRLLDEALALTLATRDAVDPGLHLERAATSELSGRHARAALADLARALPAADGPGDRNDRPLDAHCARMEALDLLVSEGFASRVAEVLGRPPEDGHMPMCELRVRLRSAAALGEDGLVRYLVSASLEGHSDARALGPDIQDILFACSQYFSARKSLTEAARCLDLLVEADPHYPRAIEALGSVFAGGDFITRRNVRALVALARAEPKDLVAAYLAGLGLYYLDRFSEAIPYLEAAAREFPEESRPAMYLAMAYFFTGDRDRALRLLDSLEPFAKANPDIYYCRSLVVRTFDLDRAIREMERFLEVFEGQKRIRFSNAKVEKARNDIEAMRRGEVPGPQLMRLHPLLW